MWPALDSDKTGTIASEPVAFSRMRTGTTWAETLRALRRRMPRSPSSVTLTDGRTTSYRTLFLTCWRWSLHRTGDLSSSKSGKRWSQLMAPSMYSGIDTMLFGRYASAGVHSLFAWAPSLSLFTSTTGWANVKLRVDTLLSWHVGARACILCNTGLFQELTLCERPIFLATSLSMSPLYCNLTA